MSTVTRGTCVFVNGLPGSGKSTYARAFVEGRSGWLNLDVDLLRGMLGTASTDFLAAGEEVRPLALAVLREYIASGGNVVFPQLFYTPAEAEPFERVVAEAGGAVRRAVLHADPGECWRRVEARAAGGPNGSVERAIRDVLAASGGADELRRIDGLLHAWRAQDAGVAVMSAATPHAAFEALASPRRDVRGLSAADDG